MLAAFSCERSMRCDKRHPARPGFEKARDASDRKAVQHTAHDDARHLNHLRVPGAPARVTWAKRSATHVEPSPCDGPAWTASAQPRRSAGAIDGVEVGMAERRAQTDRRQHAATEHCRAGDPRARAPSPPCPDPATAAAPCLSAAGWRRDSARESQVLWARVSATAQSRSRIRPLVRPAVG